MLPPNHWQMVPIGEERIVEVLAAGEDFEGPGLNPVMGLGKLALMIDATYAHFPQAVHHEAANQRQRSNDKAMMKQKRDRGGHFAKKSSRQCVALCVMCGRSLVAKDFRSESIKSANRHEHLVKGLPLVFPVPSVQCSMPELEDTFIRHFGIAPDRHSVIEQVISEHMTVDDIEPRPTLGGQQANLQPHAWHPISVDAQMRQIVIPRDDSMAIAVDERVLELTILNCLAQLNPDDEHAALARRWLWVVRTCLRHMMVAIRVAVKWFTNISVEKATVVAAAARIGLGVSIELRDGQLYERECPDEILPVLVSGKRRTSLRKARRQQQLREREKQVLETLTHLVLMAGKDHPAVEVLMNDPKFTPFLKRSVVIVDRLRPGEVELFADLEEEVLSLAKPRLTLQLLGQAADLDASARVDDGQDDSEEEEEEDHPAPQNPHMGGPVIRFPGQFPGMPPGAMPPPLANGTLAGLPSPPGMQPPAQGHPGGLNMHPSASISSGMPHDQDGLMSMPFAQLMHPLMGNQFPPMLDMLQPPPSGAEAGEKRQRQAGPPPHGGHSGTKRTRMDSSNDNGNTYLEAPETEEESSPRQAQGQPQREERDGQYIPWGVSGQVWGPGDSHYHQSR